MNRKFLKFLHWTVFPLLLYFLIIEPEDVEDTATPQGATDALATHAGMGLLLAVLVVIWWFSYWRNGQTGRPGPKLAPWAKRFHAIGHRALYWALPIVMLSGAFAGLAAPFAVMGFGFIPMNFGGSEAVHDIATEIHEIAFDALLVLSIAHLAFHLWRHYLVKDNALRIMAPKALHRWL